MSRDVIIPTININGSSAVQLVNDHLVAIRALDTALEALRAIQPHGRDFQTVDQSVYLDARRDGESRIELVRRIRDDIEKIALGIDAQKK